MPRLARLDITGLLQHVIVRAFDPEKDLVRELLDFRRQSAESGRVVLLRQLQERAANLFRRHDLANAERARRPFRDAKLHLGEHRARSGFFVPGHS